jgi:ribosomal-protein-alanine N-acetyltransferase
MAHDDLALETSRLVLTGWRPGDAAPALSIFGDEDVTKWLSPAAEPVESESVMQSVLDRWADEDTSTDPPVGHWAVRRRSDQTLLGSITLRRMPPVNEDLELAWQFAPEHWGQGYATEAAAAVARWAFDRSAHELFAVMRPANRRAKKLVERLGMQWVGETSKYYDLRLQVYRLRPPDLLDAAAADRAASR